MKLHKLTKILLIVTVVAVLSAFLYPTVTRMARSFADDSGWDSDYDSGGSDWDSGSDWDHDSSGSSGSSGGSSDPLETFIILTFFTTLICIAFQIDGIKCYLKYKGKKKTGDLVFYIILLIFSAVPIVNILGIIFYIKTSPKYNGIDIPELVNELSGNNHNNYINTNNINCEKTLTNYGYNSNEVINEAFKIYKDVQIAWMNLDVEPVRSVLSDEMFNMYKTQLVALKAKNQKNIMEDIVYLNGSVIDVVEKNDNINIIVNLSVTCYDYVVDQNNKVVRGRKDKKWFYNYNLTFTASKEGEVTKKCPNCSAPIDKEGKSIKCEYCGAIINRKSSNLVMVKKEMRSQR